MSLTDSMDTLKGVGPSRVETLAKLGLETLQDLIRHIPSRYETWGPIQPIDNVRPGEEVTIKGRVEKVSVQRFGRRRNFLRVRVADDSGEIDCLFFNQAYLEDKFQKGETFAFHGKVGEGKKGLVLPAPKTESAMLPFPDKGQIQPVYPATEGLGQTLILSLVRQALQRTEGEIRENLSRERLNELGCLPLLRAYREIHQPSAAKFIEPARRRLALQELIGIQQNIQEARARARKIPGIKNVVDSKIHGRILKRLPFELTPGQKKTVAAIRTDLASGFPMRRLLQGDVGSGKTAVAIYACLAVIAHGHQAAFMAPTEILAEQHFRVLQRLLKNSKVNLALLHGSLKAGPRKEILHGIGAGDIHLIVGTHSLFQESVQFADLAMVIIDEQHRFGVVQREKLYRKGVAPHLLSMTATPIPRTLALTMYGDLDVSTIKDRPPGRGSIRTQWVRKGKEWELIRKIRNHLQRGDQVYWVAPRIEEGEKESRSAVSAFEKLSRGPLKEFPMGLVHGKIPAEKRDATLEDFRQGKIKLLVATTLIEVGIDVPQARVMVITGAERLGLAQLHQLRGRVGRGPGTSHCYLLGSSKAAERFQLLEKTSDGFEIAEADLLRRGSGEITGLKQSGFPPLAAADLNRDLDLLLAARDLVGRRSPASRVSKSILVD